MTSGPWRGLLVILAGIMPGEVQLTSADALSAGVVLIDFPSGERTFLRGLNVALVAALLRRHQPLSRAELAERAGLARSTITGIIASMLQAGLVVEIGQAESTGGRKPVLLELVPGARLVASARLTARTVLLGLADLNGRLLVRHRRALRGTLTPADVLEQVTTWVTEMLREYGPDASRVLGLGLSLPGRVDREAGSVLASQPLGWQNVPAGSILAQRLGMPVLLEADVNALACGEQRHGAGQGARHLVALSLGAAVGGSLVEDGHVYHGALGGALGMGHLQVDPHGPVCWCGQRGCLEVMAGDSALVAQALGALQSGAESLLLELVEGRREAITRDVVVAAAQDGDPLCLGLLAEAGRQTGTTLAQVANALSPDCLLIGGEAVQQAGHLLTKPMERALLSGLVPWVADRIRFRQAILGDDAYLLGATALVLERVFRLPLPLREAGQDPLSIATWLAEV